MADNNENATVIKVSYEQYIRFYAFEWCRSLVNKLKVAETSLELLNFDLISMLYSPSGFSKDRHEAAMNSINKEVRFRAKAKIDVDHHKRSSTTSFYNDMAMLNIRLDFEDILKLPMPHVNKKDQWIQKQDYIDMCKQQLNTELNEEFDVNKLRGMEALHSMLDKVYLPGVFTEEIHQKLIKWIIRELKFRSEIFVVLSPGLMTSCYTSKHSMKKLELVLEDILGV